MATVDGISRMYDQLGPAERATLTLEAHARGDHPEAHRLMASCPRVDYRAGDDRYHDRLELAFDKMAGASIALQHLAGKLQVLHMVMEPLLMPHHINATLAFLNGLRYAQGKPEIAIQALHGELNPDLKSAHIDPQLVRHLEHIEIQADEATEYVRQELAEMAKAVAQDLLDSWEAFSRFCGQRLGVTPQTLYAAWGFPPDMARSVVDLLGRHSHLKPREQKASELFTSLSKAWIERFGEPKGANDV
jgi:hypothetical protein